MRKNFHLMGPRMGPTRGGLDVVSGIPLRDQQQTRKDRLDEDRKGPDDIACDKPRLRVDFQQAFCYCSCCDAGREEEVADEEPIDS